MRGSVTKSIKHCCLLLVLRFTSIYATPLCFSARNNVSVAIDGTWTANRNEVEGVYGSSADPSTWLASACPVQLVAHACYLNGEEDRAKDVQHRVFQPNHCSLSTFDPHQFLTVLRNRKLIFIGDSLSGQHFQIVVCGLHGSTATEYDIKWDIPPSLGRNLCIFGDEHCHISAASVYYPSYNTTIRFEGISQLPAAQHIYSKLHTSADDYIILNAGAHYNGKAIHSSLANDISSFLTIHHRRHPTQRPHLLWRETAPSHFARLPNGYYSGAGDTCGPLANIAEYQNMDARNRVAEKVLLTHNVTILRIAQATASQYDTHVRRTKRQDNMYDCQHFCFPSGVLYFWRDLLFNVLTVMQ